MRYNASHVTGAHGYKHTWTRAAAVLAAILSAQISAGQPPHGPGIDWNYGSIAEGYTSAFAGGSVEAAYRMFSAPDFAEVCAQAGADAVKSLRAVRHVDGRVGEPLPYTALKVDALDLHGVVVPRVPIGIESEMRSTVLDTRQDHIGGTSVTPQQSGTVRLRIRTLCDAPGGEVFVTVRVVR
jgi:hypothetical protein